MEDKLANMKLMKKLFYNNLDNPDHAKNYAEAIHDCLNEDLISLKEAREELEVIQKQFPRLYRIRNYIADTLAPFQQQKISEIKESLDSLEDFHHRNPENEEIAESYALSLWLYYTHPEAREHTKIMHTLSELLNAFPDNETINEKYYDVLSLHEETSYPEIGQKKTGVVPKRKAIQTTESAEAYAQTLLDYAERQNSLPEIYRTFEKLYSLSNKFPLSEFVKECCAKTLYNAFFYFDEDDIPEMREFFHKLQTNSSSEEVARIYALTLEDDLHRNWNVVEEAQRLYTQFPNNESIIDSYGYVLSSCYKDQTIDTEKRSIARELFYDLRKNHPEIETLSDYY